jgi:hypothetical protein
MLGSSLTKKLKNNPEQQRRCKPTSHPGETFMKRRDFIKVAGIGAAGAAIASPAIAQSMPEIKWRLTSSFPKSLDTIYGAAEVFRRPSRKPPTTVPDPGLAAGEIVPGLQALDAARTAPWKWPTRPPTTTSARTPPSPRDRRAVRPEQPPADGLAAGWRWG